ncbi:hypothetical protein GCM10009601_02740 [Streptomyces thermospinosisporus]|uniref:Uncharacterized protein n=1 Tax=Streptomyces thermospinosisporus TaxID=161482 RepID=A0ABP4J6J2_9ACTN
MGPGLGGTEGVGRALLAALTDEVDRRQAAGRLSPLRAAQLSPLRAAQLPHTAVAETSRQRSRPHGRPSVPVHVFIAELLSGTARPHPVNPSLPPLDPALPEPRRGPEKVRRRKAAERARAREKAWAKEQERAALREREQARAREESYQRLPARAAEDGRRRERAGQRAPELVARAGLDPEANTVEIGRRVLMREREVTPEQLRRAVRVFEETYEARVRAFSDSGGLMPWPNPRTLIPVLFGPRPGDE